MNKNIIIIVGVSIIAVVGLMALGYRKSSVPITPNPDRQSTLTTNEALYDFGTISMAGGVVRHLFTIENPSDRDITVSGVQTSCMCTTAYLIADGDARVGPFGMPGMGYDNAANLVVPAGGSRSMDVVFDPAAHGPAGIGAIDRTIDVVQANGGTLEFRVTAMVTP